MFNVRAQRGKFTSTPQWRRYSTVAWQTHEPTATIMTSTSALVSHTHIHTHTHVSGHMWERGCIQLPWIGLCKSAHPRTARVTLADRALYHAGSSVDEKLAGGRPHAD